MQRQVVEHKQVEEPREIARAELNKVLLPVADEVCVIDKNFNLKTRGPMQALLPWPVTTHGSWNCEWEVHKMTHENHITLA